MSTTITIKSKQDEMIEQLQTYVRKVEELKGEFERMNEEYPFLSIEANVKLNHKFIADELVKYVELDYK